ncbi:MAG: DUF4157 domain-containing protein [Roseiflexaceae bacterium]
MRQASQTALPNRATPAVQQAPYGLLQRACACGQHSGSGGECAECRKKREGTLQRAAVNPSPVHAVPPVVQDVLRSSGQPLDAGARAFMEPRFGRDFSGVRVHTGARAAESARAMHALAYTVGRDVVFGAGQYAPATLAGQRLLAHELAHTIQQGGQAIVSQAKLQIGASTDSAELAADQAADAVLRGQPIPALARMSHRVSRQEADRPIPDLRVRPDFFQTVDPPRAGSYTITRVEATENDDVKRVYLSNGQRYRVTRRRWITREAGGGRSPFTRLEPGIDRQKLWLELEWCSGETEGQIRVGANIPEQVINIIVTNVTSGGDIDRALRNVSITPYTEAEVRVGRWRLTAGAQTTIDRQGDVTDVQGRVGAEVDTPQGRIRIGGTAGSQRVGGNPLGGAQGGITIEFSPGRSAERRPGCRPQRERLVENVRYECQLERDVPERFEPRTRQVERRDEVTRFIYFDYATSRIDRARSATMLRDLGGDLGRGFRISGIRGFTSPEGPIGPGQRFQGNEQLSRERAEAALAEAQRICRAGRMADSCFVGQGGGSGEAGVSGLGELYTLTRLGAQGAPQEVEGAPQADFAAERFQAEDQEAPHRTPEVTRRLAQARTPQQRADLVYPLLRRAAVVLERRRTETETYQERIPASVETVDVAGRCPSDIVERAFPGARRR